ncbi:MAG: ABC transporter ATP-binding protein [Micavibrio sp.]
MIFTGANLEFKSEGRVIFSLKDYRAAKGKHQLLLGPSGCGKTTLMNILAGLLRPGSGNIAFEGQDYSRLSDGALDHLRARNFGFVFQKLHLIGHLTAAQNIAIAQEKSDPERVHALIGDMGLSGKESRKARDLSVGEAQRVAIARALANNPAVIFADEPTSALDDANTERVMNLLFEQAGKTGATLIVATHDARIKGRFHDIVEMAA